jgi:hypothetical protein
MSRANVTLPSHATKNACCDRFPSAAEAQRAERRPSWSACASGRHRAVPSPAMPCWLHCAWATHRHRAHLRRRGGFARAAAFVTTKLWNDDQGHDPRRIRREPGARRPRPFDVYLLHWPVAAKPLDSWRAPLDALLRRELDEPPPPRLRGPVLDTHVGTREEIPDAGSGFAARVVVHLVGHLGRDRVEQVECLLPGIQS